MIAVSAGHYPAAPGASYRDFVEHYEALVWQKLILQELGETGIYVPTGTLPQKTKFINSTGASVAIEIHFNASPSGMGRGCETLYYPGSAAGRRLAETMLLAIAPHFPPSRGVKEGWYQQDPSKGPLSFLKRTRCVAAILEPEFIYNYADIQARRAQACYSIAEALKWILSDRN